MNDLIVNDLIVLVADLDMEAAVKGLLSRPHAIGIRPVTSKIIRHPQRDPGVRKDASAYLRPYQSGFWYALVMLDREGCGDEKKKADELENEIQNQLNQSGWKDRSAVIALDPELEVWVFASSPHVVRVLASGDEKLWQQIVAKYGGSPGRKPNRPKEAVEEVLRRKGIARSSALYLELARNVGLMKCQDRAFNKFLDTCRRWFPP